MERTLRRIGTGVGVSLYFVWILAVIALVITQLMPGPVPAVVNRIVTAGAAIATVLGLVLVIYRTPRYVRELRESLLEYL